METGGAGGVGALAALLRDRRVVVLTGAGVSTRSGIPDYRGPETRRRARNPIRFAEYVSSEEKRARYWARSMVGWARFSSARPNAAHEALWSMEKAGTIDGLITQNVDGLHQRAGSVRVIELHGALATAGCLDCGAKESRDHLQLRLQADNPEFLPAEFELAPDGDAELPASAFASFVSPRCEECGGSLKPSVVFFGENVAKAVLADAYALFDEADVLLAVGSSLAVFSGYRFVRRAKDRGMPVAIVNLGESRGDALSDLLVEGDCAEILPVLAAALDPDRAGERS